MASLRGAVMILLSSICISSQVNSLVYNELQTLGVSCYPSDSCYQNRRQRTERDEKELTCECDQTCFRRGTCCIDSLFVDPRPSARTETCYGDRLVGVSRHYYFNHTLTYSFFQVTKCVVHWKGPVKVKALCEMVEPVDGVDLMVAIPVTNINSGVTYKNYFCALCNHDIEGSVLWDVGIYKGNYEELISDRFTVQSSDETLEDTPGTCSDSLAIVYNEEERFYGYWDDCSYDAPRFVWVTVTLSIPEQIQPHIKGCRQNLMSECAPGWRDVRVRLKCGAYLATIKGPAEDEYGQSHLRYFRNVHCALCNNVTSFGDYSCEPFSLGAIIITPTYPTSLTVLFGHLLSNEGCLGDNEKFVKGLGCRAVVCANPQHKVENGICGPP